MVWQHMCPWMLLIMCNMLFAIFVATVFYLYICGYLKVTDINVIKQLVDSLEQEHLLQ